MAVFRDHNATGEPCAQDFFDGGRHGYSGFTDRDEIDSVKAVQRKPHRPCAQMRIGEAQVAANGLARVSGT
jgi:hypothetical protein